MRGQPPLRALFCGIQVEHLVKMFDYPAILNRIEEVSAMQQQTEP
jgi:hypothetical protein